MAAASSVTSPLCTWLVAACMSVTCGGDQSTCPSMLGSSSYSCNNKRVFGSKWGRRKRVFLSKCSSELQSQRDLISSLCGSSFQGLMTSCRAFEPCNQYYASNASFSSLFGSSNVRVPSNRRHTRFNRAVHSGTPHSSLASPFFFLNEPLILLSVFFFLYLWNWKSGILFYILCGICSGFVCFQYLNLMGFFFLCS